MSAKLARREFLRGLSAMAAASCAGGRLSAFVGAPAARVGLIKGNDRRRNMLRALEAIEEDVKGRIGGRTVVIKPNLTRVKTEDWLASTPVESVSALCEFFRSFHNGRIVIAEGTGPGAPLEEALISYGYLTLEDRYGVEFVDLREDEYLETYILDRNVEPVRIRVSKLLSDPDNYIVSAALLKTHSLSVVTLGLKNLVMAAPMNFGEGRSDRSKMHRDPVSDDPRFFNHNLFELARRFQPDLVTIDGFVGMQGNGPLYGGAVESKVAIAGADWMAADRVGTEIMGFDFSKIGHYRFCAEAGMGEADLSRIAVIGDLVGNCTTSFAPPDSIQKILM